MQAIDLVRHFRFQHTPNKDHLSVIHTDKKYVSFFDNKILQS